MGNAMKHKSEVINFSAYQVFDLADILERYGVECPLDDCDAGEMFSEIVVTALRHLSVEQVKELMEAV